MPQAQLTTYQAVIAQAKAFRALRAFMGQVLKNYDLTVTEWLIIGTVIDYGPQGARVTELANTLGVEMPVVTNLVHKAMASGWVKSIADTADKRAKRIVATNKGMEDACDIEGELTKRTRIWLSTLDEQTLQEYFTVVSTLAEKDLQ